jgi:demethylspheroidene O-methyltransferase
MPALPAWWMRLGDRLLSSPRFRRWAAAFPPTRPLARHRARALFDLVAGFVYSQVLAACVELDLFELLARGPLALSTLAERFDMADAAAERLLRAACALRLTAPRGRDAAGETLYGLGPLGAAMVGNPGIAAMVRHHRLLYADIADPLALLRGQAGDTALGRFWPYADGTAAGLGRDDTGGYTGLMAASQPLVASEVLSAYRFARHRCLLDVGGGNGSFLLAVAARAPRLRLMLFDLPAVAAEAEARFIAAGLDARARAVGGDFRRDKLPEGADIISFVRVLHDHDDDSVRILLRAARRALPPGGTLLLAEPMAGTRGAEPVGDAYFGFYLLAMGSGQARTPAALAALLGETGFVRVRQLPTHTPLLTSVIVAEAG